MDRVTELYDDGVTSANMDRPALMEAVEAGELDCVVVYKVDRLSRSLPHLRGYLASLKSTT